MRKLKLFLSLLMLFAFSLGNVWADEIASGTFNGKNSIYTEGWSTTGTGKSRTDCIIIGSGENITSPSIDLSEYKSISITFTGRRYATLTGSKATVAVAFAGSNIGSIDITNGSVGAVSGSVDWTVEGTKSGTFVFTCSNATSAGSTHGAGIGSITITGVKAGGDEPGGGDEPTPGDEPGDEPSVVTNPTVTFDYADYKTKGGPSGTGSSYTMVNEKVSIGDSKFFGNNSQAHFYANGVTTITPAAGVTITKIVLTATSSDHNGYQSSGTVTASKGSLSHEGAVVTWTGSTDEAFTISHNKQIRWTTIVVTYEEGEAPAVAKPTISGEENFVGSTSVSISHADADHIYYTTNGDVPTTSSTLYSEPFELNATATVKAIAVKGSNASDVASKEFTKVVSYTTIADIYTKAVEVGSTATDIYVTFNNWIVTGVKNSNVYLTDGTNGLIIYGSGHNFEAGDILSGTAACKVQLYNGNAELTSLTASKAGLTVTKGGVAAVNALDTDGIAALTAKNTGSVIKISGEYTSDGKIAGVKVWNNLYSFSLTVGTSYECTGVYFNGGETHGNEIMPRSADDIVVVAAATLEEVTGLAALKAADRGSYIVNLTDAVVTLVDGNNAFIEDATAGALIYYNGHELAAGDKLNGKYEVTTATYQGKFEITAMTAQEGANKVADAEIPVTTLTIAELDANFAANESKRIKIVGVDVTDAIGNNDRNGQISDGTNTFALYAGKNGIAAAENDNVDIIGYPTFYNDAHQFNVWAQTDITVNEQPEEPVVSEWAEIKFAEAVAADALAADATFTAENSEFALTITDNNNKMSIDGNNANFGTADAYDTYSHRLKAGGTSSASNNMTLTIPADGTLRIAVRSASGDATNRNLLLTQNETELYNAIVKDADAVLLADEITKVYPYVTVNVKAGSVNISYPNGGLNFYSFAFKEGASEDPLEPEPVVGNKYKKVTATSDITDGKYLIVYEEGSLAFNGGLETLDAASNTIAVEIANDRIAATDETNAAAFTIAATAGTIKSANGLYIGQASDANGLTAKAEALENAISIDEEGNAVILASGGAYLRYNATSGQDRFRYFKSSTYTNQKAIALYKLVMEEEIPEWAEIVFPEAKGKDELAADADFTLSYSDFKLTLSDLDNSVSIDLPSSAAKFGTAEDGNEYTGRLKTGGSSNSMTLTIPADGLLRIAVRSANSTDNDRTLVLAQGEETLYSKVVKDADKSEDGYYPYVFVNVKAGTVSVTYPDGGLNFYAFAFNEGASIDVEPEEPETPATTKNVVILAEYNNEFYAMSTNNSSNAFTAIKVVKDGENIVVTSEEEKAAIQWTMTSNGTSATFQNAAEKYLTAASGSTNLNLGDAECAWKWYAGEGKNCYSIENEDETKLRTFLYYKNNIFKNYALTNIGGNYSDVTEVKEIAAENIIVVEPDKYVVSYNANGGSLIEGEEVIANAEYTEGAQVTVAANVYEVEGKVFAGWKYGETTYSAGQTFDMPAEDVELVAQWATISTDNVVILAKCQGQWYAVKGEAGSSNHTVAAVPVEYKDNTIYLIESKRASITWERTTVGAQASFKNGENYLTGKTSDSNDLDLKAEECWWNYNTDLATYQTHSLHSLLYSSQVGLFKNYKTSNKSEDGESGTYSALPIVVPAVFADPDYVEARPGLEVGRYYTVCLDKAVDAVRGASFWTLSSRNTAETEAYLEEVDPTTAEAGTPFIIQATDTKLEVVYTGAATTNAGTNGALHGTLTYMDADALAAAGTNIYMLYNNALRPVGTNNHLDANRAYINYNELNPVTEAPQPAPGRRVRAVPMQQNTATGIDELNGSEAPAKVLINGQLFILRGEKMYDAKGQLVK